MKLKITLFLAIYLSLLTACGGADNPPTNQTAPQNTPMSERQGIFVVTSGASTPLNEWRESVPVAWRSSNENNARYRLTITASDVEGRTCEYALAPGGATTFRLFLRQIIVDVVITDLTTDTDLATERYRGSYPPALCPATVSYELRETSRTELGTPPDFSPFSDWLQDTFSGLNDATLSTLTPIPTRTPVPTRPATSTPTLRPPHTPTGLTPAPEGATLIVTGIVVIRDENGAQIGRVSQGEYPVLGITLTQYVIEYEGFPAYITRTTANVQLSTEE